MTTRHTAYNEGAAAAGRIVGIDANPYNPLVAPLPHREWRRGYDENSPGGWLYERNAEAGA
jgi:hypothetical protein